jgi:hypothetical protein
MSTASKRTLSLLLHWIQVFLGVGVRRLNRLASAELVPLVAAVTGLSYSQEIYFAEFACKIFNSVTAHMSVTQQSAVHSLMSLMLL